jgi:sugar lactone lactonase YvrE
VNPSNGEVVARWSTEGLDFVRALGFARDVGGPALRAMTFGERAVISPEGKHLGTIKVPETVSNVAWGEKDGKTLYITASTSVYRIKLRVPGVKN